MELPLEKARPVFAVNQLSATVPFSDRRGLWRQHGPLLDVLGVAMIKRGEICKDNLGRMSKRYANRKTKSSEHKIC